MTSRAAELLRDNSALRRKLYPHPLAPYEHPPAAEARDQVVLQHPFFKRPRLEAPRPVPPTEINGTAEIPAAAASPPASKALVTVPEKKPTVSKTARWHPPWRPYRVISSHLGWVHCATFDPQNTYFATGSSDRTIKLFDTASGRLKLTLTGHVSSIRSVKISARHPYLFSASEDKMVKCWDMEYNKVIRHYHGHLSGVYALALHEMLDVVVSGGRDSTVRVWDMRSRNSIFVWGSHRDTVNDIIMNTVEPQIISASADSTVRLWNLSVAKTQAVLTNHKKGVRALSSHPMQSSFISASADHLKTWHLPRGTFVRNVARVGVVNDVVVNQDGLVVAGCDDGHVRFWDWQGGGGRAVRGEVQPGSLDAENGVLGLAFDMSGSRLVSCHVDKTIRMWKEDEKATRESDPMPLGEVDRSRY